MATICPYCNIEVSESAIEAEDGCCPECGSVISGPSDLMDSERELDEYGEYGDFDDQDGDDDYIGDDEFDDDFFDDDEFDDEEFDEEFDDERGY